MSTRTSNVTFMLVLSKFLPVLPLLGSANVFDTDTALVRAKKSRPQTVASAHATTMLVFVLERSSLS